MNNAEHMRVSIAKKLPRSCGVDRVLLSFQLKYSILFCEHSLPDLRPPLLSLAPVPDYGFLPTANMLTIFSLVQGFQDDPALRVIEAEAQLQEAFSRAVLKVNVDVENKKVTTVYSRSELISMVVGWEISNRESYIAVFPDVRAMADRRSREREIFQGKRKATPAGHNSQK